MAIRVLAPCLTAIISLIQSNLGKRRLTATPNIAWNTVSAAGVRKSSTRVRGLMSRIRLSITPANSTEGRQTVMCVKALDISTSLAFTGIDCAIHRFLPSSEMEGAEMMLVVAMPHSTSSTKGPVSPAMPGNSSENSTLSRSRLNSRAMGRMQVKMTPMEALRMYMGLEKKCLSSLRTSAVTAPLTFIGFSLYFALAAPGLAVTMRTKLALSTR